MQRVPLCAPCAHLCASHAPPAAFRVLCAPFLALLCLCPPSLVCLLYRPSLLCCSPRPILSGAHTHQHHGPLCHPPPSLPDKMYATFLHSCIRCLPVFFFNGSPMYPKNMNNESAMYPVHWDCIAH